MLANSGIQEELVETSDGWGNGVKGGGVWKGKLRKGIIPGRDKAQRVVCNTCSWRHHGMQTTIMSSLLVERPPFSHIVVKEERGPRGKEECRRKEKKKNILINGKV